MQLLKIPFLFLCFLALFCSTGCQNQKSEPDPDLTFIDLLRGDIVLCSGSSFGKVSFSLGCKYSVRDTFDLALSLLHSFEWDEAKKAFIKVIDEDPDCPMAYWGLARSYLGHPRFRPNHEDFEKGVSILKIAESFPKTAKEQAYFDAIGAYYQDDWDWENMDHIERSLKMEKKMEEIYMKNPDDKEAAIFYALSLFGSADFSDKTYAKQKKAGTILESIFPDQPNHPGIAHYIIHNYDFPELAHLSLSTARKYADIAPASAHAQHMPSHIFTRLGLWDESIQSNINSATSAVCYAEETEMDGHWHNEIHAMDYLVYAYLQKGDNIKAEEQYQHLLTIDKIYPEDASVYNFGAIPARMALENKQWTKAVSISQHASNVQWEQFPWEIAITHFARSLGASHTGDIASAEEELAILQSLHQNLVKMNETYKANQVIIQVKAAQAWIHYAKNNHKEALTFMQEAANLEDKTEKHPMTPGEVLPASELLGDMLLAMNQPSEALQAYEKNLKRNPYRFNGIYGAAMAAKNLGDQKKATKYFEEFLKLTEGSDSNRPEIEEARTFVGQKAD